MGLNTLKPSKNSRFKQGYFKPKNKQKFIGNSDNIVYRSSYEEIFCKILDEDKNVLRWTCENIIILYKSPIDGKIHRYFPDFYVEKLENGNLIKLIIEVKAKTFMIRPKRENFKSNEAYLSKLKIFALISAKERATTEYCNKKGYRYMFLNEDFFNKFKKQN